MIAQKTSFAFFGNTLHSALGYVSLFFVARYMGPEALGIVGFALAYVSMFVPVSELGFGLAHVKRVSEGKDLGTCNGTYLAAKIVLTIIMVAVILTTIFVPKVFSHNVFISGEHEFVIYIVMVSTVIASFSRVFLVTFQARKETAKQMVPYLVEKVVLVIGKVIVAVVGLGVILLAGVGVISALVGFLFLLFLFRGYPVKMPNRKYVNSYIAFAIPVMFIGILPTITQNIDKVMIQFFWSSTDVGYYVAVQRISYVLSYLSVASISLLFPTMSSYYSNGSVADIRTLSSKAERYISMVLFPAVALIFVLSEPICRVVLGEQFILSAPILIILSVVALIHGTTQPYTQQLGAANRISLAARISGVVFCVNAVLNFVFIPTNFLGLKVLGLGAVGAALATLISICVGSFLFRFYAYRITKSKANTRILIHFAAALIMMLAVHFVSGRMTTTSWYALMFLAIAGAVIYFGVLVVLHEFDRRDMDLFLKVLNPIQLVNYARREVKNGYVAGKL